MLLDVTDLGVGSLVGVGQGGRPGGESGMSKHPMIAPPPYQWQQYVTLAVRENFPDPLNR